MNKKTQELTARPRLTYFENKPSGAGWFALDDQEAEYSLSLNMGALEVSGGLNHRFEGQGRPPATRSEVMDLLRGKFDLTLLESGDGCDCGFAFEISQVPRYCPRCSARLLPLPVWSLAEGNPADVPTYLAELAGGVELFWTGSVDDGRPLWLVWSGERMVAAVADTALEEKYFDILANENVETDETSPERVLDRAERGLLGALDLKAVECGACLSMKAGTAAGCGFCGRRTRTPDEKKRLFGWLPTWFCVRVSWNRGGSELMRYDTLHGALRAQDYQYLENAAECRLAEYVGRRVNWLELFFGWTGR